MLKLIGRVLALGLFGLCFYLGLTLTREEHPLARGVGCLLMLLMVGAGFVIARAVLQRLGRMPYPAWLDAKVWRFWNGLLDEFELAASWTPVFWLLVHIARDGEEAFHIDEPKEFLFWGLVTLAAVLAWGSTLRRMGRGQRTE